MIDRLVHHAEVIALKGDSYRLKDRDLGRVPATTNTPKTDHQPTRKWSIFGCRKLINFRGSSDASVGG